MTDNIERLPSHTPPGEKRGNTTWVSCRSCRHWFHTTASLIEMGSVDLHCPSCHDEFKPKDAARIVLA
ncbi:MAG: hypothetical protein IID55_12005 [Proteobacteria bacterium]|nr:hypothetical protein [Pseudomonadota bacterium]